MFKQLSPRAALLALSFAEGPSYNGFVLAAVRGKTPSTYAADSGSGWAKDPLVLKSESMVMMRRRVPKGHYLCPFSPLLVQLFWTSSSFVLRPSLAVRGLPPLAPSATHGLQPSSSVSRPASTRSRHYLSP